MIVAALSHAGSLTVAVMAGLMVAMVAVSCGRCGVEQPVISVCDMINKVMVQMFLINEYAFKQELFEKVTV